MGLSCYFESVNGKTRPLRTAVRAKRCPALSHSASKHLFIPLLYIFIFLSNIHLILSISVCLSMNVPHSVFVCILLLSLFVAVLPPALSRSLWSLICGVWKPLQPWIVLLWSFHANMLHLSLWQTVIRFTQTHTRRLFSSQRLALL